jgi:ATP-binding cassette subfamily C (CFTR/MRP) protein 1
MQAVCFYHDLYLILIFLANALGIFSPIITLVLFAILARVNGSSLDTETAFTTTAILGMVTHPANMIMTIIPQAIASLADFQRIHQYLLEPMMLDHRLVFPKGNLNHGTALMPAIRIENLTVLNPSTLQPIISHIDLVIDRGSTVACSGRIGSGKTTLSRAIIGELLPSSGTITISSTRIGLCTQSAWLPSTTIGQAIRGHTATASSGWYDEVVRTCCLDEDLSIFPAGDKTIIGSRGFNLSGGHRQRVV